MSEFDWENNVIKIRAQGWDHCIRLSYPTKGRVTKNFDVPMAFMEVDRDTITKDEALLKLFPEAGPLDMASEEVWLVLSEYFDGQSPRAGFTADGKPRTTQHPISSVHVPFPSDLTVDQVERTVVMWARAQLRNDDYYNHLTKRGIKKP